MSLRVVCDFHAHIYGQFFDNATRNVSGDIAGKSGADRVGQGADFFSAIYTNVKACADRSSLNGGDDPESRLYGLVLAERFDCSFFRALKLKEAGLVSKGQGGDCLEYLQDVAFTSCDDACVKVSFQRARLGTSLGTGLVGSIGESLLVFAGRQIVSSEGLEILSLFSNFFVNDRQLQASDLIAAIVRAGGIAVINWAPGKWFFKKGDVVKSLIDSISSQERLSGKVLIGDTSLRPGFWGEPILMHRARQAGYGVIAGSDPLPYAGEERLIGSYCTSLVVDMSRDEFLAQPTQAMVASVGSLGADSTGQMVRLGARSGFFQFWKRYLRHAYYRR